MKVYKDKQYLVFDFEDGRNCKYDFAKKIAIGISGKPVKDLRTQLTGYSLGNIIDSCEDKTYGKFLTYICNESAYTISNIGTMLSRVPKYGNYEQFFSAGLNIKRHEHIRYKINEIPKSLIKIAKTQNIELTNSFISNYKLNVDAYHLAYKLDYISLDSNDIFTILSYPEYYDSEFNVLLNTYGYSAKALLLYVDSLKTYEALEDMKFIMREIRDYARMMSSISNKYDKYPRNLLTTHKIACRNYNRLRKEFQEDLFKNRIKKEYEFIYKDYCFIYPRSTADIKAEAVAQNNCVASYIDGVIDGRCDIMFLRKKDAPDKSLVTIEIRNKRIVQARRRFNDPVTDEDQKAIDAWEKHFSNINNKKEEVAA